MKFCETIKKFHTHNTTHWWLKTHKKTIGNTIQTTAVKNGYGKHLVELLHFKCFKKHLNLIVVFLFYWHSVCLFVELKKNMRCAYVWREYFAWIHISACKSTKGCILRTARRSNWKWCTILSIRIVCNVNNTLFCLPFLFLHAGNTC